MKLNFEFTRTENVSLIILSNAPGELCFVSEVFSSLAKSGVNIDMISQVPPQGVKSHLGFTISDNDLGVTLDVISQLREFFPEIKSAVSSANGKITISCEEMRTLPGVAAEILKALAEARVDVRLITTAETEISLLIPEPYLDIATEAITNHFNK